MTSATAAAASAPARGESAAPRQADSLPLIALTGNPNVGKTTLFNRLTGQRAKIANYAGTTVSLRHGEMALPTGTARVVDLPGIYSLEPAADDEALSCQSLRGESAAAAPPDLIVVVLDATSLPRHLLLASQILELGRPTVMALNMIDAARRGGSEIDCARLAARLGCPVAPVSASTGEGIEALRELIAKALSPPTSAPQPMPEPTPEPPPGPAPPADLAPLPAACHGCHVAARYHWAGQVVDDAVRGPHSVGHRATEAIDRLALHAFAGPAIFVLTMGGLLATVFLLAQYPMDWLDQGCQLVAAGLSDWLPAGLFSQLVTEGVVVGVGGVIVFLPQIGLLFFALSLLEQSGYMARAALLADRRLQQFGLPGKAFIPMLSAHACAIPALLATRVIERRQDRLAAMMAIPLFSCSARLPVYVMAAALLAPNQPVRAALIMMAAYGLGILAALGMAWAMRRTAIPGQPQPLLIDLPDYRWPSLQAAWTAARDSGGDFLKSAGTMILAISLAMWALANFPRVAPEQLPAAARQSWEQALAAGDEAAAQRVLQHAQLEQSFAAQLGRAVEPAFAPLGFDWRTSVGVVTSFAAREVVVSTLAILYDADEEAAGQTLAQTLRGARRPDGSPVFTSASVAGLLVFYVLAMQCLPTQAVTRKESGSWKWPALQLASMTALAYLGALLANRVVAALT